MSETIVWIVVGVSLWLLFCVFVVRAFGLMRAYDESLSDEIERRVREAKKLSEYTALAAAAAPGRRRILLVDDDAGLRLLLRTTLGLDEFVVEEAASAEEAAQVARFSPPEVVILDVGLPGMDGLSFCRELKQNPSYGAPAVVLLTGRETTRAELEGASPDAVLRKPFSPIELVGVLDRLHEPGPVPVADPVGTDAEQLLVYARDLSRLLSTERSQRRLLQQSYRQTAIALADALEAKDPVTGLHAVRVQRYATELVTAVEPRLLDDPSVEYGFLLHDVGKLAVPDAILQKHGELSHTERELMQQHSLLGEAILANVTLLSGEGLSVVRSHHERWDGTGYPDGLGRDRIPVASRIVAVCDAYQAMTSARPYRAALPPAAAAYELRAGAGTQFDPALVDCFVEVLQERGWPLGPPVARDVVGEGIE